MKEPLELGAQGAGGFEDGEHEVDFEVNFRADLEWIDGRCGIDFGSIWNQCGVHFGRKLGSVWGPFWGQFGVHVEIWQGFELQTPSGPDFWPLGPILGPFLGPMLAPCWPHVGTCWASWAILAGSWSDFEPNLRRF